MPSACHAPGGDAVGFFGSSARWASQLNIRVGWLFERLPVRAHCVVLFGHVEAVESEAGRNLLG